MDGSTLLPYLEKVYGKGAAKAVAEDILYKLKASGLEKREKKDLSEKDAVLITYADTVISPSKKPLQALRKFIDKNLKGKFSCVHLLPFFPYTSDDGFSISDYSRVRPDLGNWEDIRDIAKDLDVAMDLVLNHCSSAHPFFVSYLKEDPKYADYFIELPANTNTSHVTRARSTPLLTDFDGKSIWTTFGPDQVDFNWKNPQVLLEFVDILLLFAKNGASILRLDAIAYLWKGLNTSCIHRPEVHLIIKILRLIADTMATKIRLLSETNASAANNFSYFGQGDEADLVYNFSLPPLILYTLLKGDGSYLVDYLKNAPLPPKGCAYVNFTASHDGIGLRPLRGLLPEHEVQFLVDATIGKGGLVSTQNDTEGKARAYELNITYFCALSEGGDPELSLKRFLCSQAIALTLRGIPALYIQSLFATPNNIEGYTQTRRARTLNRKQWETPHLLSLLDNPDSIQAKCFRSLKKLLEVRSKNSAFSPHANEEVYLLAPEVLVIQRTPSEGKGSVIGIFNLSSKEQNIPSEYVHAEAINLIEKGNKVIPKTLLPYEFLWLCA